MQASNYIQAVEERQGLMVACLEEIAYRMGYISAERPGAAGARHAVERLRTLSGARPRAGDLERLRFEQTDLPGVIVVEPDVYRDGARVLSRNLSRRKISGGRHRRSVRAGQPFRVGGRHRPRPASAARAGRRASWFERYRARSSTSPSTSGSARRRSAAGSASPSPPTTSGSVTFHPALRTAFASLSPTAQVEYKCTDLYDPETEIGLAWNDPAFGDLLASPRTDPLEAGSAPPAPGRAHGRASALDRVIRATRTRRRRALCNSFTATRPRMNRSLACR